MRLLLIEDDRKIAFLRNKGMRVSRAQLGTPVVRGTLARWGYQPQGQAA